MSQTDQLYDTCHVDLPAKTVSKSSHDFRHAAIIKVTPSQAQRLESSGKRLSLAMKNLQHNEPPITQLEFGTYPLNDGHLHFFVPKTNVVVEDYQSNLEVASGERNVVPEPLASVINALEKYLPDWITVHSGRIPAEAFKFSSAVTTYRFVMPDGRKIAPRDSVDSENPENLVGFQHLLRLLRDEDFLYHVILRHRPAQCPEEFEYQLTVRVALFEPRHQLQSMADVADILRNDFPLDPAVSFTELGIQSSLDAFTEELYPDRVYSEKVYIASDSQLESESTRSIQELVTGKDQYKELFRGRYGAPEEYNAICAYDRIITRENDLPHFIDLGAVDHVEKRWANSPGRTGPTLEQSRTDDPSVELAPVSVTMDIEQDDDIASLERTTENDGTKHHFGSIKNVAQYFREQGYKVHIVRQNADSRPDLWVQSGSGEIFAVEVETKNKSRPANFYTNLARAALWGYRTIVVMAPAPEDGISAPSPKAHATWAINKISMVMSETNDTQAKIPPRSKSVTIDGQSVLLPDGVSENNWWFGWDGTLTLRDDDGEEIVTGQASEPITAFVEELPRFEAVGNKYVVVSGDGTRLETYNRKSKFQTEWTKLYEPHVPVDLSYVRFVESLYVLQDGDLNEFPVRAKWNNYSPAERHESSLEQAFTNFLVEVETDDEEDVRIWEEEFRSFVKEWISQLTDHGPPANNVFGGYRKEYTKRSANNFDDGKKRFYPDRAYRYPRGVVAPYLPGLDSRPQFPDDWNIDQRLREPLVPGLSDLSELDDDDHGVA